MVARGYRGSAFSAVLAAVIVCVASLSGCVGTAQPEVNPGGVNTSAPHTGTTAPQPEATSQAVSVELAQLPIGGAPTADPTTGDDTCVTVNWAGQQDTATIPADVQITITGAVFSTDVYAVADQGCGDDHPSCTDFVFVTDSQGCNLAIAPTGSTDFTGTEPAVSLSGTGTCVGGQTADCVAFLTAVEGGAGASIQLDPPPSSEGASRVPAAQRGVVA